MTGLHAAAISDTLLLGVAIEAAAVALTWRAEAAELDAGKAAAC